MRWYGGDERNMFIERRGGELMREMKGEGEGGEGGTEVRKGQVC